MPQRPRPSSRPGPDPDLPRPAAQPPIWAEGRQKPRFAPVAFARVSQQQARRSLGPALVRVATALEAAAGKWLAGQWRVDVSRLGRLGRIVPSHGAIGRLVRWLALLLREAGEIVLPVPEPAPKLAYPDLLRPRPDPAYPVRPQRPTRPRRPARAAAEDEPMLLSIRGLLADADPPESGGVVLQFHPRVESTPATIAPNPAPSSAVSRLSRRALSGVLAHTLIAVFLFPGAIRALSLHLHGTDLRNWD